MRRFFPHWATCFSDNYRLANCPGHPLVISAWRPRNMNPLIVLLFLATSAAAVDRLEPVDTRPLTMTDDPASVLVDQVDRFLLRQIAQTREQRVQLWNEAPSSPADYQAFITVQRRRLKEILGIRRSRLQFGNLELVNTTSASATIATSDSIRVERVRWRVLADPDPQRSGLVSITGEGLLLTPTADLHSTVIAIPDADQTPEQLCGLVDGIPAECQYARRLAEAGCRVIVPALVSRHVESRNGRSTMTDREFVYRGSFILGQHLIGYELQKLLALVDMVHNAEDDVSSSTAMIGYGEGGLLALFAGALDPRIHSIAVSGCFGPRESSWQEPLDRNIFGLLNDFGAAQLATMIAPRLCLVEAARVPDFRFDGNGGAPAVLTSPQPAEIRQEVEIAKNHGANLDLVTPENGRFGSTEWLQQFLATIDHQSQVTNTSKTINSLRVSESASKPDLFVEQRRLRQLQELDRHNQALLRESPFVRKAFMSGLDTSSVSAWEKSVESYRDIFRHEVIGQFDSPLLPPNAHSRQLMETDFWTAHEVWLEVFSDVGAYGVLLLPKNLRPNERRPVVVCQHGLEGRPLDTIQNDHPAYHDYAAKLCEQGFITFAPQNIYIFGDRFRTLQRKANPLGKTLFSIMVPQHQQIVNWLKSQPYVDGDRIAFYGLSYGGKSAMRIPALVTDYCLSICSADFNEWVLKNATTRHNFSYMWTGEYEIFEWNLGRTFNYSEMAALICPRPFMVERGHFDGVGEDNWVAHEYAKIRYLYAAELKIPDRTAIEWFPGPHTINGQGTFEFLHRHLNWKP